MSPKARTDQQEKLFDIHHPAAKKIMEACRTLHVLRRERMQLTKQESEAQEAILALLKKHDLTEFDMDGVHAEIVVEKEKVRVKITPEGDGDVDTNTESEPAYEEEKN